MQVFWLGYRRHAHLPRQLTVGPVVFRHDSFLTAAVTAQDLHLFPSLLLKQHMEYFWFSCLASFSVSCEIIPDVYKRQQQQHVIDTIKAKYPWVDIIFGTHNIHQLPQLLENALSEKKKQIEIWPGSSDIVEGLPCKRLHQSKADVYKRQIWW